MIHRINLVIPYAEEQHLGKFVAQQLNIDLNSVSHIQVIKRSMDARATTIKLNFQLDVYTSPDFYEKFDYQLPKTSVANSNKGTVIIVGAGPAGLFAALKLIALGLKPIILERGKDVKERRRDLALINKLGLVNPESNYCFGEGGAGTYSDGKLYTRSTKRGDVNAILQTFVSFGADERILSDAHPHIGTNKLPGIISRIRNYILDAGGEVHFESKVVDFILNGKAVVGVRTIRQEFIGLGVILATGHSARDIFELLAAKNILVEPKSFAMGVRIEHPQLLIDEIQYKHKDRMLDLPPAAYSLVHQVNGRGVFSFCMCPGGIIAPCATSTGEVVTNGWSPSKRNNKFANAGMVTSIESKDLLPFKSFGAFAGMQFQQELEQHAFKAGGGNLIAPGQRMVDFCSSRLSANLPENSYHPGVKSIPLHEMLPHSIGKRLQVALAHFGTKMKGFYTNEAILVGVETRTSSPVRIPRNPITLEHITTMGLYPCAEGAGYAGGIVSAAVDGQKCAMALAAKYAT